MSMTCSGACKTGLREVSTDLDGDALLAVDGLPGDHVLGAERVLLGLGDEDTVVLVPAPWLQFPFV